VNVLSVVADPNLGARDEHRQQSPDPLNRPPGGARHAWSDETIPLHQALGAPPRGFPRRDHSPPGGSPKRNNHGSHDRSR